MAFMDTQQGSFAPPWGAGQAPPAHLANMSEAEYKASKEAFVSGLEGGPMWEVLLLMCGLAVSYTPT